MTLAEHVRLAERLERAGYWRRAQRQWLVVMEKTNCDAERELACLHRNRCARKSRQAPGAGNAITKGMNGLANGDL